MHMEIHLYGNIHMAPSLINFLSSQLKFLYFPTFKNALVYFLCIKCNTKDVDLDQYGD